MRVSEDLLEQTQEEILETLTFSKKWELSKDKVESSDKDLRLALINDLMNCYGLKDIVDFIKYGKTIETEKYLNEFLLDNKLI